MGGLVATRKIVSRLGGVVVAGIIRGAITNGCWYGCAFEHGLRLGSRNASQTVGEEKGAITDHGDENVDGQEQKTRSVLLLRDAVCQIGIVLTHLFVDAGKTLFGIGAELDFLLVMALDLLGELVERGLDTVLDLQNIPLGGKGTSKLGEFGLDRRDFTLEQFDLRVGVVDLLLQMQRARLQETDEVGERSDARGNDEKLNVQCREVVFVGREERLEVLKRVSSEEGRGKDKQE